MNVKFQRRFITQYKRFSQNRQKQCDERLVLFETNPFNPTLNNHALQGKYLGYRSINMTGNIRVVFRMIATDTAYFIAVGTHAELYE